MSDAEFSITAPCRHVPAVIGGDDCIQVTIGDNGNHEYDVTIYYFPFDPSGDQTLDGDTVTIPRGGPYSIRMPIDTSDVGSGTAMNRFIEVTDNDSSDIQGYSFRAIMGGSGSFGHTKLKLPLCKPGQLVSRALSLTLDTKVKKGSSTKCAELNKPAMLLYSDDAKRAGWFSRPIAFCGKGELAGHWVLERNSATAWTLQLKQGQKVLVKYVAKTKSKDCSLPVKLTRQGVGSKVCQAWPKTITIRESE